MSQSKPTFNFMLVGKTGNGKSATGNTLINRRNVFKASNRTDSCTKQPQLECGECEQFIIKVVDTPGIQDTKVDMKVTLDLISNAMAMLPDGFDALLLVMKYGEKSTKEVVEVISALRASFGEVFAKEYCIIVMTHGDNFDIDMLDEDDPETFDDYCKNISEPPELLSLLVDCEYRVVPFYNKHKNKREETIARLVQHVQNMKLRKYRYNSDVFARFATERNRYVIGLKLPQLIPAIQEKLSLLQEKLEKWIADPDANKGVEIKINAQQLLDTIEEESNGTSLMDDLKSEVRRMIRTIDTLSSSKHERQQKLEELKITIGTIKNPPSSSGVILSGMMTLVNLAVGSACIACTPINPAFAMAGLYYVCAAREKGEEFVQSVISYNKEKRLYDRALEEMDEEEDKMDEEEDKME